MSSDNAANGPLVFLREFFRNPRQVASMIPSSRQLQRCVVDSAEVALGKVIVELGPGTGGTTRAILQAMAADARLLSIEINPRLYEVAKRIRDSRLILHHGDARGLADILASYGLSAPDIVISGIPLSTMRPARRAELLEAVASALTPRGRYVTYQVGKRSLLSNPPELGSARVQKRLVLLNFPPLWVLRCEKMTHSEIARTAALEPVHSDIA